MAAQTTAQIIAAGGRYPKGRQKEVLRRWAKFPKEPNGAKQRPLKGAVVSLHPDG